MSDRRLLTGLPARTGSGRGAPTRRPVALRMRRHVDFCRTSAAICRS